MQESCCKASAVFGDSCVLTEGQQQCFWNAASGLGTQGSCFIPPSFSSGLKSSPCHSLSLSKQCGSGLIPKVSCLELIRAVPSSQEAQ